MGKEDRWYHDQNALCSTRELDYLVKQFCEELVYVLAQPKVWDSGFCNLGY